MSMKIEHLVEEELRRDENLLRILKETPAVVGEFSNRNLWESSLKLIIIFSGDYGLRVLENMLNSTGHCISCGHLCIDKQCKYGKYSFADNIVAVYEVPPPNELPEVIDDPLKYLPSKLPKADLALATGLHSDLYLELPEILQKSNIDALIVFREDPRDAPRGLVSELRDKCSEYGIEFEAPKPSCTLRPSNKQVIDRFIREFRMGKPLLKLDIAEIGNLRKITSVKVYVSAPCGTTWYVARQMLNYEISSLNEIELRKMYDFIALHHHAAPCIGSMSYDPELGDTILHWGSYIEREAYLRALGLIDELRKTVQERLRRKVPCTILQ